MIDNPEQTERLVAKLTQALPFPALTAPPTLAALKEQAPDLDLTPRCRVTQIHYAGDEGGILCKLDFGVGEDRKVFYVSITHLTFDPGLPLAREIAAYQRHRVKRLRREGPGPSGIP
jgi:hypothetical protein